MPPPTAEERRRQLIVAAEYLVNVEHNGFKDDLISQVSSHMLTYSYTTPAPTERGKEAFGLDVRGRMMLVPLFDVNGEENGVLSRLVDRMGEVYSTGYVNTFLIYCKSVRLLQHLFRTFHNNLILVTMQTHFKLLNALALFKHYLPNNDWHPLVHLFNHSMDHARPCKLTPLPILIRSSTALAPSNTPGSTV
ncbi:hypothetical protein K443DRAFT_11777 [Laccaria amethystina LaAM-08-1]|uniref:Uncharacterized protein n=1 Tax=Laccaria amethystina LaAM-08-1 TaxID=1095629 RepID=A0A0C9X0L0_9AGAR|nr:hypothetical protein K443DRAFT_11777 [Laccaria amethystina LaAM-08-1]